MFFAKENREPRGNRSRSDRYYGGELRNLSDAKAERKFRKLGSVGPNVDFLPISKTKLEDFQYLHEINQRKAAEHRQEESEFELMLHIKRGMPSNMSELELELETRRRKIIVEFQHDSKNVDLLEQYLKINEEIFDNNRAYGSGDRKALAERQIAIIDQAITCHPRMIEYRLKRLHILKELRPSNELLIEWEKILNAFVNNCSVWEKYLNFVQYDMTMYSVEALNRAFDRCFTKLQAILNGSFRSHKPEENTEIFLLHVYVRRLMWWMECGYTNRAIASVQASIEYNFRAPAALAKAPEQKKMNAFAEFWNSGVPRFGDKDAKGWDIYFDVSGTLEEMRDPEFLQREVQTQSILDLEQRISSSSDDAVICWVEMERELDNIESRPRRRLGANYSREEQVSQAQKEVGFEDIRILPSISTLGGNAIAVLLRALGVQFSGALSCYIEDFCAQTLPCPPTFKLLEEWNLLPPSRKLFSIPSTGAKDIALNMVYDMTKLSPSIEFMFAMLETIASQIDEEYWDKPKSVRIAKFEEQLREVMKDVAGINFGVPEEEFKLAVVAYALSILERWVQNEGDNPVDSAPDCDGSTRKKRKRKKEERPLTRPQFIEKLKNCLLPDTETPLHLLSPGRLQVLLRLLLLLTQSYLNRGCKSRDNEQDMKFVRDSIACFFLRKHFEKVSPTSILNAIEEWKKLFRTLDMVPKAFSCFQSPRALSLALRIYLEYTMASKTSDQWIEECDKHFTLCREFPSSNDRSVILHAYIDVLKHHWLNFHSGKEKLLEVLEAGRAICPRDSLVIRRLIEECVGGLRHVSFSRALENGDKKKDPILDMYHSLSLLYLEKLKAEKLQKADVPLHTDVIAQITRTHASRRMDPALWRLAMAQCRCKRFFDETHVMATAQCGWSRHLHIDCVAASGSRIKCEEMIRLMEERGALVFNELEYIDVLKEAAALE